jgi:uncharacterized protein
MSNHHGDFIWYELMTSDADASMAFYGPLLGWTFGGSAEYREITVESGDFIGGMLPLDDAMIAGGARPAWLGYVQVDDVDAMAESVKHSGGSVIVPPRDLPEAGRFAMVTDPQGAPFYIMKPKPTAANPDASSNAFSYDRPRPGHCAWNELMTADPEAARHFYGQRFGWVKDGEMDMGPMGMYEFLRHAGRSDGTVMGQGMLGAVMGKTPEMPSAWNHYFRVADIDAAKAHIEASGGTIIHGPAEIPGGDYSMNAIDPQGASFGLVGSRKG